MVKTLTCKGCGTTADIPKDMNNVGDMMAASNFSWVMAVDGGSLWVCKKDCMPKVAGAYILLEAVLGNATRYVSLLQLNALLKKAGFA